MSVDAPGRPAARPPSERLPRGVIRYQWVYLWHWPVRTMHWIAALCIAVLVVTGFYIGAPYFLTAGEPSGHYLMGWARFLHFAAAGVLVATGIVRVYWLFKGNRFERWRALFPVRKRDWVNLGQVLRAYIFVHPGRAPHYMGHNPIQQFFYTGLYLVAVFQVVTGFGLYGLAEPTGFFFQTFGWVGPLFGGWQVVRFLHHIAVWAFLIFIPLHVYLSVRADVIHAESRLSSIISGRRYVRADIDFVDEGPGVDTIPVEKHISRPELVVASPAGEHVEGGRTEDGIPDSVKKLTEEPEDAAAGEEDEA